MKKTLAAVAVLGAFAGSAIAADVTLYGRIDEGLLYQRVDGDQPHQSAENSWGLESGNMTGSRFGIKGSEQISEDLKVSFTLEQGFNPDDGSFGDDDRMFNREASLRVTTAYGELGFGRMGRLLSDAGTYAQRGQFILGSSWAGMTGGTEVITDKTSSRLDNMITYKSPTFGGVTVYAQASLQKTSNTDEVEGSSDTDRYYALGATGNWGALSSALTFSTTDYSRTWVNDVEHNGAGTKAEGREDMSKVVTGYVAYDFGMVKPMLSAQYFDDVKGVSWDMSDGLKDTLGETLGNYSKKGYGVMLGATAPLAGGTAYAMVGYNDFEATEDIQEFGGKAEFDTINFGIGYQYPLSKRTYVYTAAGYTKLSGELKTEGEKFDADTKTTEVVAGIVHNF